MLRRSFYLLMIVGLASICFLAVTASLSLAAPKPLRADRPIGLGDHSPQSISTTLKLVGQLGGKSIAVDIQGNYAYLGVGPRMLIFNISNPTQPVKVGQTDVLSDFVYSLMVSGTYAYVAPNGPNTQVLVFDVSDPALPKQIGSTAFTALNSINALRMIGHTLYAATSQGLSIFNMANPTLPVQTGNFTTLSAIRDLAVQGNYAYLADEYSKVMRVVDLSTPAALTQTGVVSMPNYVYSVVVSGAYAYLGVEFTGVRIISITNPLSPTQVGALSTPAYPDHIILSGTTVYAASDTAGLSIIDVANPISPTLRGAYDTPTSAYALARSGHSVFVADTSGMQIIDVSSSISPTLSGVYAAPSNVDDVVAVGQYDYESDQTDGLRVIDVSDPARPQEMNVISSGQPVAAALGPDGNLYVADQTNWLRVLSLSNPLSPTPVSSITSPFIQTVATGVLGDVYTLGYNEQVSVISVTQPSSPTLMGFVSATAANGFDLVVSGTHAYVAVYPLGMRIIDVSKPISPTRLSFYPSGGPQSLALDGSYAYLVGGSGGSHYLKIISVTNPVSPTLIGSLTFSVTALGGITVKDNLAYIGSSSGVQVVDVSAPVSPTLRMTYWTGQTALHFAWHGSYLAAGVGTVGAFNTDQGIDGLYIFQTGEVSLTNLSAINDSPTTLGHSTTFMAGAIGSGVSFTWNFGDGQVSSSSVSGTLTHTYASAGYYTARVTATDSINTLWTTTPVTITATTEPISGLSASNSGPTLIGHSTALTATIGTGSDVTYTWNFGDHTLFGFGKTIWHTYSMWGSFTATVTATNSLSTAMTSTPIEVVPLQVYLPLVLK